MFTSRTATGLTIALLALPATAAAQVEPNPDNRVAAPPEPVPAVTAVARDLRSPDTADAAAGRQVEVASPTPAVEAPAPAGGTDWAPIAFGGGVLLVAAGGLVRVRVRSRRVPA